MKFEKRAPSEAYRLAKQHERKNTAPLVMIEPAEYSPDHLYLKDSSVLLHTDGRAYIARKTGQLHAPSLTSRSWDVVACEGAAGTSVSEGSLRRMAITVADEIAKKLFDDFLGTTAVETEIALRQWQKRLDEELWTD